MNTNVSEKTSKLPEAFRWECYEDGSGCIFGPNNKHYFSYDMAPYSNVGWIEYQRISGDGWRIFEGTLSEYKTYVEEQFADFIKQFDIR